MDYFNDYTCTDKRVFMSLENRAKFYLQQATVDYNWHMIQESIYELGKPSKVLSATTNLLYSIGT